MNSPDHKQHNNLPRPVWVMPKEQGTSVRLEEGALLILRPGRPRQPIPLRRISRVHLNERVQVSTEALLACGRRGIVVQVQSGAQCCVLLGRQTGRTGLRQRLADLQERPDWQTLLQGWLNHLQQRVEGTVRRRIGIEARFTGPALRQWLNLQAIHLAGKHNHTLSLQAFTHLSQAVTMQALQQHGLGAGMENLLTRKPGLHKALARLLELRLETARLGWLHASAIHHGEGRVPAMPGKQVVRQAENRRPQAERLMQDYLNRLHRWLVDLQQEV